MSKKNKSLIGKFIKTVSIILGVFFLASAAGLFFLSYGARNITDKNKPVDIIMSAINMVSGSNIKKSVNIAVFGVDEDETRTDVIFITHFDIKTKEVSLLSVPRDTRVSISGEAKEILDTQGNWYPDTCKMNEVHAYAGDSGAKVSVAQLEALLDIDIDHYVEINLEGFRNMVDIIGGVEVDVPQDMYHDDPYINLKKGLQPLDGEKAEQLVRFRSYVQGDVTRISTQQLFLSAFAKKLLKTDTLVKNLPGLIKTMYTYVSTDLGLDEILKYAYSIKDVDTESIQMETLPGSGQYVGNISYFIHDPEETKVVVNRLFFEDESEVLEDSKSLKIEVVNGSEVSGLAAKNRDMLLQKGYNVEKISTYNGEKENKTRIIVRKSGYGEDLIAYFPGSSIIVDSSTLDSGIDIKIILGTEES